jgi:hypothetical protein
VGGRTDLRGSTLTDAKNNLEKVGHRITWQVLPFFAFSVMFFQITDRLPAESLQF